MLAMAQLFRNHAAAVPTPLTCTCSVHSFDKRFAEAAPELAAAYKPPEYFDDDLFGLLEGRRPDWRWLIVGGARSGSAWHKDPNGTSAWNATLRGRKRWLFFPPRTTPPGVRPSADGLDLVAPLSIAEWTSVLKSIFVRPSI